MRGERRLLRAGEYLVGRACQWLPPDIREERYREWAAELPAILHDPQTRLAPRRAVRMLSYAADTLRGTIMTPAKARRRTPRMTALLYLLLFAGLVGVGWDIWAITRAPGHRLNYVRLAWSLLLVAWPISQLARSALRTSMLISISGTVAGVVFCIWNAALAPGDWTNDFWAAFFLLLLLTLLLVLRWARARRA